jgi:hypothetical protein
VICYVFTFIICSCLLFSPSAGSAQNPNGFLTFGNCTVGFLYPQGWKDFITDYSKCKENDQGRFEDSITEITFPQPSLSEKITPRVAIIVEPCCEFIYSRDAEGGYSAEMRNMSVDEYVSQELDEFSRQGYTIINSGSLALDGNPASKVVVGPDPLTPTGVFVYSINATISKLFTISYTADPSDYDTYLPGVQKIVDSFRMLIS